MAQPDLRTQATVETHLVGRGYAPDAWETIHSPQVGGVAPTYRKWPLKEA